MHRQTNKKHRKIEIVEKTAEDNRNFEKGQKKKEFKKGRVEESLEVN